MFLGHNSVDKDRGVRAFADRLGQLGLRVFVDERLIDDYELITEKVNNAITGSLTFVAWYSEEYPARRACQLELKAAYVSAEAAGEVADRILVVNPVETSFDHIHPATLRDAKIPPVDAAPAAILARVEKLQARQAGPFGSLARLDPPPWLPQRGLGSARFVGRVVEQWELHERLQAGRRSQTSREPTREEVALVGFGGSGKSLLAEEYAHSFGAAYPGGIYALSAAGAAPGRESALLDQLLMIAGLLGVGLDDKPDPDLLRHRVGEKLAENERALWLVDDLPEGLAAGEARAWAAPHEQAATLITTRSTSYTAFAQVRLEMLDEASAIELLTAGDEPGSEEEREAARVIAVELLGCYAQAVDVAGAQIRLRQGDSAYRDFLRRSRESSPVDRLEHAAQITGQLPNGHETSIVSTLRDAIESLEEDARDLLRLASQLAVEPIDLDLAAQITSRNEETADEAADRLDLALSSLEHASLARPNVTPANESAYLVHTLIAATAQHIDIHPERTASLRERAIEILGYWLAANADIFYDQTHTTDLQSRVSHARHLTANLTTTDEPNLATLAAMVASLDYERGSYGPARRLQEEVVEAQARLLGREHPDTLASKNNLAGTLRALGDLDGARRLQEEVVEAQERLLGGENQETLNSKNNLAGTLRALGDLAGARRLEEEVLTARERLFGGEHPDTLTSKNNLAGTLEALGDLEGARRLREEVLEAQERLLGGEHPATLTSKNGLAGTLRALGDLDGARRLEEEVVAARERLLGGEHPDTLTSKNGLAVMLWELGDLDGARRLQEEVVEAQERLLGGEHPSMLTSKNNLAAMLRELGDLAGSRGLLEEVVAAQERLLGGEHPSTLASKNNLAEVLRALGDLDGARRLQEEVVAAQERLLGREHPDTLTSKNNLAGTLYALGDLAGSRFLVEEVFEAQERLLGGEHPDTLTSKLNLAVMLRELGDLDGSRRLQEEVLEARERLLGVEHPDTLTSKNFLAGTLRELGDLDGARRLEEEVVAAQERSPAEE